MKSNSLVKGASLALIFSAAFVFSCKEKEDRLTAQDTVAISEEATTDTYYQDMDDMASVAVDAPSDTQYSGGRSQTTITVNDDRFKCSGIVVTITPDAASTPNHPKGVITVDFGTGCSDSKGNIRKGKLIFTYDGARFETGSKITTTTDNYYINNVKLEGTRTVTNVTGSTETAPKFNVILSNGKATFSDGAIATRESNITWSWIRATNPLQDQLIIDQSSTASGTTRLGRSYSVSLLKSLKYLRTCVIAVEGIKQYVIDGSKTITIDYGNGDCDKSVAVTVNGVTRNLTISF
jgi:hypothetical protein